MNLESFLNDDPGVQPSGWCWLACMGWQRLGSIQQKQIMMTKTMMMMMVSVSGDCDIGDSLLGDGDGNGDD